MSRFDVENPALRARTPEAHPSLDGEPLPRRPARDGLRRLWILAFIWAGVGLGSTLVFLLDPAGSSFYWVALAAMCALGIGWRFTRAGNTDLPHELRAERGFDPRHAGPPAIHPGSLPVERLYSERRFH
jgi:hypothetical protein